MNNKKIVAKVFLGIDNNVYIITRYNQLIQASALNIFQLFKNPLDFLQNDVNKYSKANFTLGVKSPSFDNIYGISLATIDEENTIVCESPMLFELIYRQIKTVPTTNLMYLPTRESYIIGDERQTLINFLLSLSAYSLSSLPLIEFTPEGNNKSSRIVLEYFSALSNTNPSYASFNGKKEIIKDSFAEDKLTIEDIDDSESKKASIKEFVQNNFDVSGYITAKKYAELHGYTDTTVRTYCREGRLKSAKKNDKGMYVVHKDDFPVSKPKENRPMPRGGGYKATRNFETASYIEVQEYIQYNNCFSTEAGAYIRTMPELYYYMGRKYKEVEINGRPSFIIDINPDYIIKGNNDYTGKSNRELIKSNMSPIVPGSENGANFDRYQLHHVGQSSDAKAPFAVIPESDHIRTYFKIFHDGSSGEDLHDKGFELEKKTFWQNYLRLFDEYKEFKKIKSKNILLKKQSEANEFKEKVRAFVSKEG